MICHRCIQSLTPELLHRFLCRLCLKEKFLPRSDSTLGTEFINDHFVVFWAKAFSRSWGWQNKNRKEEANENNNCILRPLFSRCVHGIYSKKSMPNSVDLVEKKLHAQMTLDHRLVWWKHSVYATLNFVRIKKWILFPFSVLKNKRNRVKVWWEATFTFVVCDRLDSWVCLQNISNPWTLGPTIILEHTLQCLLDTGELPWSWWR